MRFQHTNIILDLGYEAGVNLKPYLGADVAVSTGKSSSQIGIQCTNIIQTRVWESMSISDPMLELMSRLVVSKFSIISLSVS